MQNKLLRILSNAPWFVRNDFIHRDLKIKKIDEHIKDISRKFFTSLASSKNPTIAEQIKYTKNDGKYSVPYTGLPNGLSHLNRSNLGHSFFSSLLASYLQSL
ncbi:hypothetical protein AVEN_80603-1 [Araneus ventricosus]|uniref:RNA-directed DNA polymerase from mobile element jockey n=1 Tax=Araneus ventricosus TaxID=182803 RepID=A0A4Y2KA36_ARAVE|nr:hypothetical protein AVEN_80603-1 [Araneus ventricosus]